MWLVDLNMMTRTYVYLNRHSKIVFMLFRMFSNKGGRRIRGSAKRKCWTGGGGGFLWHARAMSRLMPPVLQELQSFAAVTCWGGVNFGPCLVHACGGGAAE